MDNDVQLPRLVTLGLFILTGASLACGTLLKLRGIEATDLTTIAAGGVGALAGFIARGRSTPQA